MFWREDFVYISVGPFLVHDYEAFVLNFDEQ